MPDLLVLFSCHDSIFQPHASIKQAANLGIPLVGLVDSNCDPRLVSYPVPGNDDSPSSIHLFGSLIGEAVMRGKRKRAQLLTSLGKFYSLLCNSRQICAHPIIKFTV